MRLIVLFFLSAALCQGQTVPKELEVFFDAQRVGFDRKGDRQVFEGDVVAIAAGTLILADHIELDRIKKTFEARGNILLISSQQVFTGDELHYDLDTGDFSLTKALLTANSEAEVKKIVESVLGVSPQEIEFEVNRQRWLQEIEGKKNAARAQYLKQYPNLSSSEKKEREAQYEILLREEAHIKGQENIAHFGIQSERYKQLQRRRQFWKDSQEKALMNNQNVLHLGYFRLQGKVIERIHQYEVRTTNGYLTPCFCAADESPAWAFQAEKINAQVEGYADLYNPVLEIKGVPVLYLPYLRIPAKSERQSGFLLPSITYDSLNGNIFSESLFLDIGKDQDATITTDYIEKRGFRLGAQYRHERGTYSGWETQVEGLQDRLQLGQKATRQTVSYQYEAGFKTAKTRYDAMTPTERANLNLQAPTIQDPGWWASMPQGKNCLDSSDPDACIASVLESLQGYSGGGRGKVQWKGQTFLAPRWSFMSQGNVVTDHRYTQDLYFTNLLDVFDPLLPQTFSKVHVQSHLDAENFYLGVGSHWGDQMLLNSRFSGYQNPLAVKLQSRFFSFGRSYLPHPIYGQADFTMRQLSYASDPAFQQNAPPGSQTFALSNGGWRRFRLQLMTPILTDKIFLLDAFSVGELRSISSQLQEYKTASAASPAKEPDLNREGSSLSSMRTVRFGLNLSLPMEGKMPLLAGENPDVQSWLEHRMTWKVTLSMRPFVVRRGQYGEIASEYTPDANGNLKPRDPYLTYFPSDLKNNIGTDYLPEQDFMFPHQKIILSTNHDWFLFDEGWNLTPKSVSKAGAASLSVREQAQQELTLGLDESIHNTRSLYNPKIGEWNINRYSLQRSNQQAPLSAQADIDYDWVKARQRKELQKDPQIPENALPQPWSELRSNVSSAWRNWTLALRSRFNLYSHTAVESIYTLTPPTVFDTTLTLGLGLENNLTADPVNGGFIARKTLTKTYGLRSTLIPHIETLFEYGNRTLYEVDAAREERVSAAMQYSSPSKCWGLKFSWLKEYEDPTWAGTYFAALIIRFFTYDREVGNLANRWNEPS